MKIILVTDKPRANAVEYFCNSYGGIIVAVINMTSADYENKNIETCSLGDVPALECDLVIVDCCAPEDVERELKVLGVGNVYRFWRDRGEIIHAFSSDLLCRRDFRVENGSLQIASEVFSCRKETGDIPSANSAQQQLSITREVFEAYRKANAAYSGVPVEFRVGENWRNFLKHTRPTFYDAIERADLELLSSLLLDFFRNELTGGTFGGREGYQGFCDNPYEINALRSFFNVWKHCVSDDAIAVLDSPKVGNPYGMVVDGSLLNSNSFCNHYRAQYLDGLVRDAANPVVVELGGGFGGLGYFLTQTNHRMTYINFDLPENLIVSSYYLKSTFKDKKIKLYDGNEPVLTEEDIRTFDIILLPHFAITECPERVADVFVNTISLSEMDYQNIEVYFAEIQRITGSYFYHENMLDNGAGYKYFPVSVFPELQGFKRLMNAPSRWPAFSLTSPHHCHMEFLYERMG